MVVWVRPNHGTEFSAMRLFFRTVRNRVLKVGIWANFGSGLLENECWTLLWPVFRTVHDGF